MRRGQNCVAKHHEQDVAMTVPTLDRAVMEAAFAALDYSIACRPHLIWLLLRHGLGLV